LPKGIGNPLKILRDRDRELQLFPLNEEFLVSVSHQLTLITSLPFVHTARRCPGLSRFEKSGDCCFETFRGGDSLVETALIAVA
uniref:Ovule protein n=1 Tax=Anisakis simplex TaxID=6269 RepID=A0A0M3J109_ANISI